MAYILWSLFWVACTKDIYQPTVFTAETLPLKLEEKHCPLGTELRKIEYAPSSEGSNYCWDPNEKTKHGPFLSWDITGRWYFHYDQGKLSHIPIFLSPSSLEDNDRLHSFMTTYNDAELLKLYLEQLSDPEQQKDIQLRLFSMGKLDESYFFPTPLDVAPCQQTAKDMACVSGGVFSYQQGEKERVFFRAFEAKTLYADQQPVTTDNIYNCRSNCNCQGITENGPALTWAQANAYCQSQGKQLPSEVELLQIYSTHDKSKPLFSLPQSEWTRDWHSPAAEEKIQIDPQPPCPAASPVCSKTTQKVFLHKDGLRNAAKTTSKKLPFRCVGQTGAANQQSAYPVVLSSPPALAELPPEGSRTSWWKKDEHYRLQSGNPIPTTPKGFDLTTSYKDIYMVSEILYGYHERYPEVTQLVQLEKSIKGFPILALRITDKPNIDESEPAILVTGAHHGHELLTVDYALSNIQYLLENYKSDAEVLSWITSFDIWVVPLVNPDGNWTLLRTNAARKVGRKNGRQTDDECDFKPKEGVDISRNYPFQWGVNDSGKPTQPLSPYFKGFKPASEPETRALMDLAEKYRFVMALSWHTAGTAIIPPYSIDGVRSPYPNLTWDLAKAIAADMPKQPNGKKVEVKRDKEPIDGNEHNWMFNQYGTLAYIVGGSHHNPQSLNLRQKSISAILPFFTGLMKKLMSQPAVYGYVTDTKGNPLQAKVHIREHKNYEGEIWNSRPADGFFYRIFNKPGVYTIHAEAKGYISTTKKVNIQETPVTVSIKLRK